MRIIGIIGGLDFVGCDVTLKFLADNYRVKVAVLSPARGNDSLIRTGISANKNLQICRFDPENFFQFQEFVRDCTILIHCGIPYKLCNDSEGIPIYVPIIKKTGVILEVVREAHSVKKVIFVAAPALNGFSASSTGFVNDTDAEKSRPAGRTGNQNARGAWFHANRIVQNYIRIFSGTRFEIIFISPVGLKNNTLLNSSEITLAGLKFLFTHKISHDALFQKLILLGTLNTLLNVRDIPEMIFRLAEPCLLRDNSEDQGTSINSGFPMLQQ